MWIENISRGNTRRAVSALSTSNFHVVGKVDRSTGKSVKVPGGDFQFHRARCRGGKQTWHKSDAPRTHSALTFSWREGRSSPQARLHRKSGTAASVGVGSVHRDVCRFAETLPSARA